MRTSRPIRLIQVFVGLGLGEVVQIVEYDDSIMCTIEQVLYRQGIERVTWVCIDRVHLREVSDEECDQWKTQPTPNRPGSFRESH